MSLKSLFFLNFSLLISHPSDSFHFQIDFHQLHCTFGIYSNIYCTLYSVQAPSIRILLTKIINSVKSASQAMCLLHISGVNVWGCWSNQLQGWHRLTYTHREHMEHFQIDRNWRRTCYEADRQANYIENYKSPSPFCYVLKMINNFPIYSKIETGTTQVIWDGKANIIFSIIHWIDWICITIIFRNQWR